MKALKNKILFLSLSFALFILVGLAINQAFVTGDGGRCRKAHATRR